MSDVMRGLPRVDRHQTLENEESRVVCSSFAQWLASNWIVWAGGPPWPNGATTRECTGTDEGNQNLSRQGESHFPSLWERCRRLIVLQAARGN